MKSHKPIIGIIPTFNLTSDNNPYNDKASFVRMYSQKIKESGGIPIGILENVQLYTNICDGYVWPGGKKILKEYIPVIEDAIKNKKPILGVCLGAQTLSNYFTILEDRLAYPDKNYDEVYDINKNINPYFKKVGDCSTISHNIKNEVKAIDSSIINQSRHKIKIDKESLLYEIFKKEEIDVVSLHNMAINRTSRNVLVSAKSEDNIIEAIEYKGKGSLVLGVQFHPEIENDRSLFDWLISSCNKYLTLVNRSHKIKYYKNFKIINYTSKCPNCKKNSNLEENTFYAWKKFKNFLKRNGYNVDVESAFRTKEIQSDIYKQIEQEKGSEYAKKYVAKPGFSEHELGLAIDVCILKDNNWLCGFDEKLEDFYKFMQAHCAEYGFILRYPKGKENITKYNYEPWHIRYIGSKDVAKYIMNNNLSLEEYLESF